MTTCFSRRRFLCAAGAGLVAAVIPGCSTFTGRGSSRAFKFAQFCDPQLGFGGHEHDVKYFRQAIQKANELGAAFIIICGDLVNVPSEKAYAEFRAIRDESRCRCYCVPGNHDVGNQPTAASLGLYRWEIGRDYYSFRHEGFSFVIMNTQLWKTPVAGETEKQDGWLEKTLSAATRKGDRIIVAGHNPLFLKLPDEPELYFNLAPEKRRQLLALFQKHNVRAMLAGHTHRLLINEYSGMQMVNGENTSKSFDLRPYGFRLWHVAEDGSLRHEPVLFP